MEGVASEEADVVQCDAFAGEDEDEGEEGGSGVAVVEGVEEADVQVGACCASGQGEGSFGVLCALGQAGVEAGAGGGVDAVALPAPFGEGGRGAERGRLWRAQDVLLPAAQQGEVAAAAAEELIRSGNTNFPMTGQASVAQPYPTTENWQKAVGGYQVWSHSNVRVEGNKVTMEITVKAEDRYNFNRGQADIATGAGDDENGRFTEIGWAKPFDTHGTITRTVTWEVGHPPGGPTGEPGEDREPRGSGRDRGPTPDNPRERR